MEAPRNGEPGTASRRRALTPIVLLVALGVLAAAVIGGISLLGESPSSSSRPSPSSGVSTGSPSAPDETQAATTPTASPGAETSVFDLEVGDCFSASEDQLETVVVVSCDAAHVFEVYHVFDHEAGGDEAYPGDDEILEYADTECQVPFEDFVGMSYQESIWYITSVTPSQETWDQGDREIVCTLNLEDRTDVTGSAEGSAE